MSKFILRLPAVIRKTGLSKSTIYFKMSLDEFPRPIRLGARSVGWLEADIDHWLEARISETFGENNHD
tara:strand:- start:328 stop:531 length:204 start_codon:yes stop_codon:yes gene_type:complete